MKSVIIVFVLGNITLFGMTACQDPAVAESMKTPWMEGVIL